MRACRRHQIAAFILCQAARRSYRRKTVAASHHIDAVGLRRIPDTGGEHMAAELVGVDELRSNHDLCALHAGNADHLRVVNIDIDTQKDVADGGGDGFDFILLLLLRLVVQVAMGCSLDA